MGDVAAPDSGVFEPHVGGRPLLLHDSQARGEMESGSFDASSAHRGLLSANHAPPGGRKATSVDEGAGAGAGAGGAV